MTCLEQPPLLPVQACREHLQKNNIYTEVEQWRLEWTNTGLKNSVQIPSKNA